MTPPHGPVLNSLIRARLRGSAMGIIIPSLVFIGQILLLGVLPSFFSAQILLSTVVLSALTLFGIFFFAGTALFQGVNPAPFTSGISRKILAFSGWVTTLIHTLVGIALWCGVHLLFALLPWQVNVTTGNSIEYLSLITLFLLNFGALSHILSPALSKGLGAQQLLLIPLYIFSFSPLALIGMMAFTSVDPALSIWLTVIQAVVTSGLIYGAWRLESRYTYTT